MNKILALVVLALLAGCIHSNKTQSGRGESKSVAGNNSSELPDSTTRHFTDRQLETFMDSIGHLPAQSITDRVAFEADSVFKSPKQLDTTISPHDFETLKHAAQKGVMKVDLARRIFKNPDISYDCTTKSIFVTYKKGLIQVVYIAFNKQNNSFDEFALYIGDPAHCGSATLYFFKGSKIISVHEGYDRFAPELKYYKDLDGKTVVYYGKNFGEGTGFCLNRYYFYKYNNDKLIPILDEVELANSQPPGFRARWLESTILSTHPLTMKMVYNENFNQTVDLPDTTYWKSSPDLINDATVVRYTWDDQSKTLKGNYGQSKLSKAQINSFYTGSEYVFINAQYKLLKPMLQDRKQRKWVLWYLDRVKTDRLK